MKKKDLILIIALMLGATAIYDFGNKDAKNRTKELLKLGFTKQEIEKEFKDEVSYCTDFSWDELSPPCQSRWSRVQMTYRSMVCFGITIITIVPMLHMIQKEGCGFMKLNLVSFMLLRMYLQGQAEN